MTIHSCYHSDVFAHPTALRDTCRKVIGLCRNAEFDAIACRGVSGLAVAAPIAAELSKQLIFVRKTTSNSHATSMVEGIPGNDFRYIIIDDFTASGDTLREIKNRVDTYTPGYHLERGQATFLGTILYFGVPQWHDWRGEGPIPTASLEKTQ